VNTTMRNLVFITKLKQLQSPALLIKINRTSPTVFSIYFIFTLKNYILKLNFVLKHFFLILPFEIYFRLWDKAVRIWHANINYNVCNTDLNYNQILCFQESLKILRIRCSEILHETLIYFYLPFLISTWAADFMLYLYIYSKIFKKTPKKILCSVQWLRSGVSVVNCHISKRRE
jgi:hypothetical protein